MTKKPTKKKRAKRTVTRQVPPPAVKNPPGRDLYRPEYVPQIRKMAQMGWTHVEMASFLNVTDRTFRRWLVRHPEINEALLIPEEEANKRVALSLYQLAVGYEREEEEIKIVDGKVLRIKVIRYYPGNASAAIFWQKAKAGWTDNPDLRDPVKPPADDGPKEPTMRETDKQIARRIAHAFTLIEGDKGKAS